MCGWKHHLKMTFHSEMSGQSVSEGDGVLTLTFSTTFLPPSSLLSAHGQLQSSLTEASLKASPERGQRQKRDHLLLHMFFLAFHTSIPVQLLSNQPAVRATRKWH